MTGLRTWKPAALLRSCPLHPRHTLSLEPPTQFSVIQRRDSLYFRATRAQLAAPVAVNLLGVAGASFAEVQQDISGRLS